jgi:uncharacterized protein (TIGR02001 family)
MSSPFRLRSTVNALAISALFSGAALAQTAAPAAPAAPEPEWTFTGNVSLVSDYRFRGISQTYKLPAVQGGFDVGHKSGFYAGTWASNVSGNQFPNGAGMEWDFYGGWKTTFDDFGLDVGTLYYYYPGAKYNVPAGTSFDNWEVYIAGSWKFLSLKYSYGATDFFGLDSDTSVVGANGNSRGAGYLDLTATYEIMPKLNLIGHVGHQWVPNYGEYEYTDWKVGASYDLGWFTLSGAYVDTNADEVIYSACRSSGSCKELGKGTFVVQVSKTF